MFEETWKYISKTMSAMDSDMQKLESEINKSPDTLITNNGGHIVITGKVKSLRVNDQVIELNGQCGK